MAVNFPKHVLVIDDDRIHLEILEKAFTRCGATTVSRIINGDEAAGLIDSSGNPFDLVVLDLCMPGFDGFETLASLDKGAPGTRFILLSGMPREVLDKARRVAESRNLNLIAILQKPASISALMEVVKLQN